MIELQQIREFGSIAPVKIHLFLMVVFAFARSNNIHIVKANPNWRYTVQILGSPLGKISNL